MVFLVHIFFFFFAALLLEQTEITSTWMPLLQTADGIWHDLRLDSLEDFTSVMYLMMHWFNQNESFSQPTSSLIVGLVFVN